MNLELVELKFLECDQSTLNQRHQMPKHVSIQQSKNDVSTKYFDVLCRLKQTECNLFYFEKIIFLIYNYVFLKKNIINFFLLLTIKSFCNPIVTGSIII